MFGSLIDYVRLSASSVTTRLIGGLAIAVPLIIAFAFGIAASYIAIADRYGELKAAIALAVAFALIAVIAAIAIAVWRKRQEALKEEALARARNSALASALFAANPALLLGIGRAAVGIARRAPLLTIIPLAAGFIYAMSRSSSREEEHETID
jgi:heme exporter protein D